MSNDPVQNHPDMQWPDGGTTKLFNEADIEAAARKIAVAAGCREHDWAAFRVHTRIALDAAVASLEKRGALREGKGYKDSDGSDCWDATTGGFPEPGGFPVAIIRIEEP